ncbi:hypothetical protein [Nonomuraea pusilla]|uniref:Uncharacterized protein n=1 Tax=Nonomuraea pusilla TaxID=46177 RepID=A0A1H7TH23_9ACTN|nr:hypothetical protein [Nonomuraea pusilla]SEL83636.1 hypothetical protein SAMN05660976_03483 [Nonomuraea pusilla]
MVLTGPSASHGRLGGGRPLAWVATGFVLAFAAVRLNGFDLLLDPLGWGLCAAGLSRLGRTGEDPFGRARTFAVGMVWVSAVALAARGALTEDLPMDSSVLQVVELAERAGSSITVWVIADAVIGRIRLFGRHGRAAFLDVLRWAVAAFGILVLPPAQAYLNDGYIVLIAWLMALVVLVLEFYRLSQFPPFLAEG